MLLQLAATVAASNLSPLPLAEVEHAIAVGRLDQARAMIATAVAQNAPGGAVDRLLADLAFATGNDSEAAARYEQLLRVDPANGLLAERAGIAALRAGEVERAAGSIDRATALTGATWRAWNARGVIADFRQDWTAADEAFARATRLAPDEPSLLNNRGWSQLLRGQWGRAVVDLERAAGLDPASRRIANNLELARVGVAEQLPERGAHESDQDWAARLNDAGVAAQILGQKARAIAAYARAIESSATWYQRAANNLRTAEAIP